MPYCPKCGVELEHDEKQCPLCYTILGSSDGMEKRAPVGVKRYPDVPAEESPSPMPRKTKQWVLWEVASFIFGTSAVIVFVVDITHGKAITWSAYPLVALVCSWLFFTLLIFANRIPWLFVGGSTCTIVGLLAGIDIIDGSFEWFWGFGFPIVVLTLVVLLFLVMGIRRVSQKGMNVLAFILLASAVFSLGIDLIIGFNTRGSFIPTWSVIVLLALVPASGFLLYLHYRLKKTFDFEKFFRL
jgi:uncharacterized membrane protein YoaK (UPF0700 family)